MQLVEKIIICKLIEEMDTAGFVPVKFWDGEEYQTITWKNDSQGDVLVTQRELACITAISTVDEGTLHFASKFALDAWGNRGVLLILGNGEDVISDYHCGNPDFSGAVERVYQFIEGRKNNG